MPRAQPTSSPTHPKSALEIFGRSYLDRSPEAEALREVCGCPFQASERCDKMTKGRRGEAVPLGTCSVGYSNPTAGGVVPHIICPTRIKGVPEVFERAIGLMDVRDRPVLRLSEQPLVDTSLDYVLAAVDRRPRPTRVLDFVALEIQALDTTGSVFQSRQDFLAGLPPAPRYTYGINWRMSLSKTTLQQAVAKGAVYAGWGKRIVWAIQDVSLDYLRRNFDVSTLRAERREDPVHFHAYNMRWNASTRNFDLVFAEAVSTDVEGIRRMMASGEDEHPPREDFEKMLLEAEAAGRGRPTWLT